MLNLLPWPPDFPRAKRLRFASGTAFVLWVVVIVSFVISVGANAKDAVLTSLGAAASLLFAAGVILQGIAVKREWRELSERSMRDDLRATRSRRSVRRARTAERRPTNRVL